MERGNLSVPVQLGKKNHKLHFTKSPKRAGNRSFTLRDSYMPLLLLFIIVTTSLCHDILTSIESITETCKAKTQFPAFLKKDS